MPTHAFFDPLGAFAADATDRNGVRREPRPLCYKDLLGPSWWQLPAATRARFDAHEAHYFGTMTLRATTAGVCVALLSRLVGSPRRIVSEISVKALDSDDGSFRFTMTIRHALLGELFHHDGVFHAAE